MIPYEDVRAGGAAYNTGKLTQADVLILDNLTELREALHQKFIVFFQAPQPTPFGRF